MTAADRLRKTMSSLGPMISSVRSARHDPAARMRNVDLIAVELHLLAQGDPAHFCVCGVLSRENQHTTLLDIEIT